jgi:hypothetical protein
MTRGGWLAPSDSYFKQPRRNFIKIVIASEAKQSILPRKERMDCFASLAMTARHTLAFPRRDAPEFEANIRPKTEGAGNAGRLVRPQPRVVGRKHAR